MPRHNRPKPEDHSPEEIRDFWTLAFLFSIAGGADGIDHAERRADKALSVWMRAMNDPHLGHDHDRRAT